MSKDFIDFYKNYLCPYCGTIDIYKNYMIMKSDGFYRKICKCSMCKESMKIETLIADMTPFDWGLWLYVNIDNYKSPHNKFRDKVHFKLIYANLDLLGNRIKKGFRDGYYHCKNNEITYTSKILEDLNFKYGIWKKKEKLITLDNFKSS